MARDRRHSVRPKPRLDRFFAKLFVHWLSGQKSALGAVFAFDRARREAIESQVICHEIGTTEGHMQRMSLDRHVDGGSVVRRQPEREILSPSRPHLHVLHQPYDIRALEGHGQH